MKVLIRDFCVLFLLIQVPQFITWLLMIVNSWLFKVHSCVSIKCCTIPTKNLKTREYLRRGASLLSDVRLKMPLFLCSNQKEKEKTKLKPIHKQIPKQNCKKPKLHSASIVTEFFNSCVIYTFFLSSFWAVFYVSLNMAAVLTVWTLITDQLRDTLAPPLPPPPIMLQKNWIESYLHCRCNMLSQSAKQWEP